MPGQVIRSFTVIVGGVDISDHVNALAVEASRDTFDMTPQGSPGRFQDVGVPDGVIAVAFLQDWYLDSLLYPVLSSPTAPTVSASLPGSSTWTIEGATVVGYRPLDGDIGAAGRTQVNFLGALTLGGGEHAETGAGVSPHIASGSRVGGSIAFIKTGAGVVVRAAGGVRAAVYVENGAGVLVRSASGARAGTAILKAGTGLQVRAASGADAGIFAETGIGAMGATH